MILKVKGLVIDIDAISALVRSDDKSKVSVIVNGFGFDLTEEEGKAVWDAYHWARKDAIYGPDKKKYKGDE
jgi:hypothetical protein